jgi:ribosomal protein S18 acetylase RimI-like enzyme
MDADKDLDRGLEMPYPHYRCPVDGEALPLTEARIAVTCSKHQPEEAVPEFAIRTAGTADRAAIEELCDRAWGETEIDTLGTTFDVLSGDNLLAEVDGHVVLQSVYPEFQGGGIGKALLDSAVGRALERRLPFVKVAVSNDDIASLYFYQRHGFVITDIALGTIADRLGSAVQGFACIPIRDEIRLRRPVAAAE